MVAPDKGSMYGLKELNRASFTILIFAFKLRIYAKQNCLKYNYLQKKKKWFGIKKPTKVDMP